MPPPPSTPHVTGLFVYPVKSCRGHSVAAAEVDAWGFVGDRRFMVVSPDGHFLTQRQHSRMALIDTELTARGLTLGAAGSARCSSPSAKITGRNKSPFGKTP